MNGSSMPHALDGYLVTEIGGRVAAGVCGWLLAQLGATGVYIDGQPSAIGKKDEHRDQFAAGKLSFAPDLSREDDRNLLRRLLSTSDAVITSSDVDARAIVEIVGRRPDRVSC